MTTAIKKATSKGQITLPKSWRNQFKTDNYILEIDEVKITITPINIKKNVISFINDEEEESKNVIFDAHRDNKGKGISPQYFIDLITKINKEEDEKK